VLTQALAGAILLLLLWTLFRFAMGLRSAKLRREGSRVAQETDGRRVVAEIPREGGVVFFVEDERGFAWGDRQVSKDELAGARLLLNGGVVGSVSRGAQALGEPPSPEAYEGRERWDVILYLRGGGTIAVPCGTLREGASREVATHIFQAVRAALGERTTDFTTGLPPLRSDGSRSGPGRRAGPRGG